MKSEEDGSVMPLLASYQCGQGSIPAWCYMWVELTVGLKSHLRIDVRMAKRFALVTEKRDKPAGPDKALPENTKKSTAS